MKDKRIRNKIELNLLQDSMNIDDSVVNTGFISPYHNQIITTLKCLRDYGDTATFYVDNEILFVDEFNEYIKRKKVKDVEPRFFKITRSEPVLDNRCFVTIELIYPIYKNP